MINGIELIVFLELMFWGLTGFIVSLIQQYLKYQPRIIKSGGFCLSWYLNDNWPRIIGGFLLCFIGVSFYGDVFNKTLSNFDAFLLCFFHDKIIDTFTNRKK